MTAAWYRTLTKKHGRLTRCPTCQGPLSAGHERVCSKGRKAETELNRSFSLDPSFKSSLTSERRRDFYERHKSIAVLMVLIVFISPILGVFLEGVPGLLVGAIVPIVGYYLLPYLF